jgi:mRNA-degrading endonuclease RelE of RelBE toxin-antitoxin system
MRFKVEWSKRAMNDLKKLNNIISNSKIDAIYYSPEKIIFPEQYQFDDFRKDCRRIIEGNYKILYQFKNNEIRIIRVFNSLHDPIKSLI